jgi:hypothetical protein
VRLRSRRAPGGGFAGYSDGGLRRQRAGKRTTSGTRGRRFRCVTCRLEQVGLNRVVQESLFKILRELIATDFIELGKPPV